MTTHLTTHILDSTSGTPAAGVDVSLARFLDDGHVAPIAEGVTDADGRLALGPERLEDGTYTLTFSTGAYFAAQGVDTFYPAVLVTFSVEGDRHCHVPLLLSPFAYSTYRGS